MATKEFIPGFLVEYSDSSFTNPHEVLAPDEPDNPHCYTNEFTHMGAKFWGFETRRHMATTQVEGEPALEYDYDSHNWFWFCFKKRALITEISVSTKFFTGNQVQSISVTLSDELTGNRTEVLTRVKLNPDADHDFTIEPAMATECLVDCYYEGGIARFNCFGVPADEQLPERRNLLEDAKISHVSNAHYGKPETAVTGNREVMNMVGWESARTGYGEQALFHLAEPAEIDELIVDTYQYRLNAPLSCHVFGLPVDAGISAEDAMKNPPGYKLVFPNGKQVVPEDFATYMAGHKYLEEHDASDNHKFQIRLHHLEDSPWQAILPFGPLRPDTYHRFNELLSRGPFSHILFMHYPNGGIHGLKVFGRSHKI